MAQFLSDEWLQEMQAAANAADTELRPQGTSASAKFTLKEVVKASPNGDIAFTVHFDGERIIYDNADNATHDADVTIAQDYETAVELHKGTLTIREAFFASRVRIAGNLNLLLDYIDVLRNTAPSFATVRANTTYRKH